MIFLASVALTALALGASPADDHLRRGAAEFRAERYADALVEFEVATRLGAAAEARAYAAATLVKLGRADEAVTRFSELPDDGDPLIGFYRAVACYDAKLYACAQARFSSVEKKGGPRLAAEAQRALAQLVQLSAQLPPEPAIDWYLARGDQALAAGRASLAALYYEEAMTLGHRRPDCHGCQAAERGKQSAHAKLQPEPTR